MNENVANIENDTLHAEEPIEITKGGISNEFYIVSKKKFIWLYFSTFGFYSIYWFFKNWILQKKFHNETYWPAMRGLFYIFFTHSLFRQVDRKLKNSDKKYIWDHGGIATQIVMLTLASNLLGRLASKYMGSPYTDIGSIALAAVMGVLLLRVQMATNLACNDSEGESNNKLSALNIFWIVIGGIFTLLAILGIFFTDADT
ncbi:hypothetical protein GCM10011613_16160 [Cellvibrio zantedeschiae]|uniref:DUF4234 domain-containing protein n=1 Tax=Cellvibrio zantedeschiae TaxID=1237077 RepID=A0ABQ3AZE9_9GAMM|nr:hypothetical protein [Cellvibrio zantedeschiae]GGY72006.1 hypothetical protein GCM10011613_16160 [Cellvibrio zantedeschiae]